MHKKKKRITLNVTAGTARLETTTSNHCGSRTFRLTACDVLSGVGAARCT